jgi:hypothetical protein
MVSRDWFDDDPVEEVSSESDGDSRTPQAPKQTTQSGINSSPDPLVAQAIQEGVAKLKLAELKDALKVRGLHGIGSKEELKIRLFESLMKDTGMGP